MISPIPPYLDTAFILSSIVGMTHLCKARCCVIRHAPGQHESCPSTAGISGNMRCGFRCLGFVSLVLFFASFSEKTAGFSGSCGEIRCENQFSFGDFMQK